MDSDRLILRQTNRVRGGISEKDSQRQVVELAGLYDWRVCHISDSRRQAGERWIGDTLAKGWPDLVLARAGRVLFRELKTQKGRLTQEQRAWLDELAAAGLDAAVWRPSDWAAIADTLAP